MRKIRILGIVPYEGMRVLMRQAAQQREDIELTTLTIERESWADIAALYTEADFDVIVSYGFTAGEIQKRTVLPVVAAEVGIDDVLHTVRLAQNCANRFVLVGSYALTRIACTLNNLLALELEIRTAHTQETARTLIKSLPRDDCEMFLCDGIADAAAQDCGAVSMLITPGARSVMAALEQAAAIGASLSKINGRAEFFQTVLEAHHGALVVYNDGGALLYTAGDTLLGSAVKQKMAENVPCLIAEKQKELACEVDGTVYLMYGLCRETAGQAIVIYTVDANPVITSQNGIHLLTREAAADPFFNAYCSVLRGPCEMPLEAYAKSSRPVMILGEAGSGTAQMAHMLYARGENTDAPATVIDCTAPAWTFLMTDDHSPLRARAGVLLFEHIELLSEARRSELLTLMRDTKLAQHCRVLICCECDGAQQDCAQAADLLTCLTLHIPTLRANPAQIPILAGLFLNLYSRQLAKETAGFQPEALEALKCFDWSRNYDQLLRVIGELVTAADAPYIGFPDVTRLLEREQAVVHKTASCEEMETLDLSRTLEEIERDVVARVMEQENGNQSAAAKRLGIGRTTLWRMLQKQ